jgi:NADPH-dependent 2,4-dienoyl-CoA reductase/sulfur reductase-like enzyme
VGGGAGGCGTASKFVNKFGPGEVAVIEPNTMHYYQPLWTLVGGGVKTLAQSGRPMDSLLPKAASWLKDSVAGFEPENNRLVTESGDVVNYEFLVVAMGLELRYDKIKGLPEAFDTPGVGSNYSVKYVEKTHNAIQQFKVFLLFICIYLFTIFTF